MKKLAFALTLVAAATSAQAQKVFRCVDERGKTYYTEQPGPQCKPVRIDVDPAKPAPAKPPAATSAEQPAGKVNVSKATVAARAKEQHCSGLSNAARLLAEGKTNLNTAVASTRRAAIEKELAKSCQ